MNMRGDHAFDGRSLALTGPDELAGQRSVGLLILEPDTEGRLSGALAKHGEGPIALYLRLARLQALPGTLSIRAGNGPLGPARLVISGDPWGPFLILVEGAPPDAADRVPSER